MLQIYILWFIHDKPKHILIGLYMTEELARRERDYQLNLLLGKTAADNYVIEQRQVIVK